MEKLQPEKLVLAVHGQNGFAMYRVPGLIVTEAGTVLAYCEGRGTINKPETRSLLLFRSEDGGQTFSERQKLVDSSGNAMVHNPLMIAGRGHEVHFLWNESYSRCFYKKSSDDGQTWGETTDLTPLIEEYRSSYPWTVYALAPGHGIQMRKGTLVVSLWLSCGINAHQPACFSSIYSEDGGVTWNRSSLVRTNDQVTDPTEGAIAEKKDGTLLATVRHSAALTRKRAFIDGGPYHWGKAFLKEQLPDPICAGSIFRLDEETLLFCNCANEDLPALKAIRQEGSRIKWSDDARKNLTIRISGDDGCTWSNGYLVEACAGYSDLSASPDHKWVYCFYESGWIDGNCIFNQSLSFSRIPAGWIK